MSSKMPMIFDNKQNNPIKNPKSDNLPLKNVKVGLLSPLPIPAGSLPGADPNAYFIGKPCGSCGGKK